MKSKKPDINLDMSRIFEITDIKNRIIFLILMLVLYRLGSFIPLPGIDPVLLKEFSSFANTGVFSMFNMISGGSLERMSIFTLSIMPYITSSIIIHILSIAFPSLAHLKQDGELGKRKLNQYTKYLTILLCLFQSFTIAVGLYATKVHDQNLVIISKSLFITSTITSLTAGTMLIMWFAEQITNKAIGNGISMIIFSGIISGFPANIGRIFSLGKSGLLNFTSIIFVFLLAAGLLYLVVFMERASRNIVVNYPKRQQGNKIFGGESSYLPIKMNNAGVIPPIFASSLLLFPHTISAFGDNKDGLLGKVMSLINHGTILYVILYAALIMFFSFFYTSVIFNPKETADNLKKYGGFITGKRPGAQTSHYLENIIVKTTVIGSLYLVLVCIFPEIVVSQFKIPFYIGGTSILIMVNVIVELFAQIQSKLFNVQYKSMIKKYSS